MWNWRADTWFCVPTITLIRWRSCPWKKASRPPTISSDASATWESKPRTRPKPGFRSQDLTRSGGKRSQIRFGALPRDSILSPATQFANNIPHKRFRIPEEHQGSIQIVERIVDARESRAHTALDHHHSSRLVHIENRHSINRAGGIVARRGVGDVIGSNDQGNIGLHKIAVDRSEEHTSEL